MMPRRPSSAQVGMSLVAAQNSGRGCWYGRGQMFTCGWVKNFPSQLNGPSWEVSAFSIRSMASHSRSRMRIGLASPDTISVAPDLTKPISSRPREITSMVAYSVATRTGSGRTVINVPNERIRTFFVRRATMPVMTGLAAQRLLIPE